MAWWEGRLDELRDLWENHREIGSAEIAERFGVTKCAVVGLANRRGFAPRREPARPPAPPTKNPFNGGGCVWPIGQPKEPDFRFCGAEPLVAGKPYCEWHAKIAYVRPKDAAAAAAA